MSVIQPLYSLVVPDCSPVTHFGTISWCWATCPKDANSTPISQTADGGQDHFFLQVDHSSGYLKHDWQQILADYGPSVWRTGCCLLGNEADARDCYQPVFLKAFQATIQREWSTVMTSTGGLRRKPASIVSIDEGDHGAALVRFGSNTPSSMVASKSR